MAGLRIRAVGLSEIAAHPYLSLDPNDYLDEGDEVEATTDGIIRAQGLDALASLFSHDADLIVIDEDGTGVLDAASYRDLYAFYALLRGEQATIDEESFRSRVRAALDRVDFRDVENGIDDLLDHLAEEVVGEFTTKEEHDGT